MNTSELLVVFKDQLLNFTDELLEIFPNEPKLILTRVYIENNLIVEEAVKRFGKALNGPDNLASVIQKRNESFFAEYDMMKLNNDGSGLGDQANFMLELWNDKRLDDEDKSVIWTWVDLFVNITQCYLSKN
jgi:hypothetical protein